MRDKKSPNFGALFSIGAQDTHKIVAKVHIGL